MEEDYSKDLAHVPWNVLNYILHPELPHLGSEVFWCRAVW